MTDDLQMKLLKSDSAYVDMEENISNPGKITRPRFESIDKLRYQNDYTCEFACKFHNLSEEQIAKTAKAKRQLFCASAFCFLFMVVELVGGYVANSLALMSDATHLLSDFAGLMISITALWLTQRQSDMAKHSYGFHRAEIIGAMFSIFLIWGLTIWLVYEAINRLINPETIDGQTMFIVACLGILVNVIMGAILFQGGHHSHGLGSGGHDHSHGGHGSHGSHGSHGDHGNHSDHGHSHAHGHDDNNNDDEEHHGEDKNINVRSAFVHVLGDLVQSVGVMIAGAFIWYDHNTFRFMDPVCTLIFSIIVVFTTISIMKDALAILMENVPKNIEMGLLEEGLRNLPDVADLHDLHVWNLTVGKPALSVHLLAKSNTIDKHGKIVPACVDGILRRAQKLVAEKFGIEHSTIQIEWPREVHSSTMHLACPDYCSPVKNELIDHDDHKHTHDHDHSEHNHNHKDHKHDHKHHKHDHKHNHTHDHKHDDKEHNHNHNHDDHDHNHKHDDKDKDNKDNE